MPAADGPTPPRWQFSLAPGMIGEEASVMQLRTRYQRAVARVDRLMNDPSYAPKQLFDQVIFFLILVSVGLLIAEVMISPGSDLPRGFLAIDHGILWIFAVEYAMRLWVVKPELPHAVRISWRDRVFYHVAARVSWALRPMNLIDLIAILPLFPFLRSLRILRVLKLFSRADFSRKLFHYFDPFEAAGQTFRTHQLLYLFVATFIMIALLLGAATAFVAEHRFNERMATPFDAVYWAAVTLTTVGYGDITPVTPGGRVVAMALMGTGFFILALMAGVVSQTLGASLLKIREEGIRMTAMVNHIVICGWNRHTPMLLQDIRQRGETLADRVVVFADREAPEHLPEWVTFVKGDPTQETDLSKVRMGVVDAVLVVADEKEGASFSDADARTLLTVFTIRSFERKLAARGVSRTVPIHVTAELLDPDNLPFLREAGANEIIQTARLGSTLMAQSAAAPSSGELFDRLLIDEGGTLRRQPVPARFRLPMPFWELASTIKREADDLPIGLARDGRMVFNPPAQALVHPGDELIFLSGEGNGHLPAEDASFWGPIVPGR